MLIAIYGLSVQTVGIGIAFLIGTVICQELARIFRRRPILQNYSALAGLLFVTPVCGAEIAVVFVISAFAARQQAHACSGASFRPRRPFSAA